MRFDWPLGLLALLLVPIVVLAYLAIERRRARYAIHYTNIEVLASVTGRSQRWRSYIPPLVALVALICALAAVARPEVRMSVASEQASIALTVDTSGSMAADDVKPTRLGAAEGAIRRFLDEIPKKYRVGLVTFSSEPFVVSPLTFDRQRLLQALQYDLVPGQGTAIGDALARSVELLQPVAADGDPLPAPGPTAPTGNSSKPLSAILLLSDGAQTRGTLQPLQGAARAKSYGIPIYTVALGTPNGTLNRGGFARPVPPDPGTLRQIALATGGEFFATQDQAHLNAVYEDLASRLGRKKEWREVTYVLVGLAALFALCAGGLSLLWNPRLP